MRNFWRAIALALGLAAVPAPAAETAAIDAGQRIYREGILPSGLPLRAAVEHDVELSGARAACINCHRRSGYGGREGNRIVPPIGAGFLFGEKASGKAAPQAEPKTSQPTAYDATSFKRALREGLHFAGRPLSTLMPRYAMSDAELDLLIGYLRTLSAAPPPGVTAQEIHFATVVTADVPAPQRQALLGVMNAFFDKQNAERKQSPSILARTPLGHGRIYRATQQWRLHVWELQGVPETWPGQIERYYREQPVYAVLGGVGRGDWQGIHAQCERLALPCLFPNPEHLQSIGQDFFSVYFTRGLAQEAELLAQALLQQPRDAPQRIVQVYRANDSGALAAQRLRRALAGAPGFEFEDHVLVDAVGADADFWRGLLSARNSAVVLWLRPEDLARMPGRDGAGAPIYLSDTLLDQSAVPAPLRQGAVVLSLRELPANWRERRQRVAAQLQSYGLTLQDERIQTNTLVALTLVSRVLTHLRDNLTRELLIERIEHMAQSSSWSSIYPQLSLGPGQRVASLGGYRLAPRADGSLPAQGAWIVSEGMKSR